MQYANAAIEGGFLLVVREHTACLPAPAIRSTPPCRIGKRVRHPIAVKRILHPGNMSSSSLDLPQQNSRDASPKSASSFEFLATRVAIGNFEGKFRAIDVV